VGVFTLKNVSFVTERAGDFNGDPPPDMTRSLLSILAAAVLLGSAPAFAGSDLPYVAKGPGSIFSSVDAAATDGLAWAHQLQRAGRNPRLSRGGTIVRVADGYSYGPLVTARASSPDSLQFALGRDVVAHFHTYPHQNPRIDRRNESHSQADRWVVDRLDPKHRPSFVLTPSLRVVAYHGRGESRVAEKLVVSLGRSADGQMLAAH